MAVYLMLTGSLPMTRGEVALTGLHDRATIERDRWGIANISARSDLDVFFALGFVHAQDRMWQMDYKRRFGRGRLSEILGVSELPRDKLMRTLGLYRAAEKTLTAMPAEARESLRAYAAGVNAWIDGGHRLPVEYSYYNVKPEHWTEVDSLLMAKLFAFSLSANYTSELSNQVLLKHLGSRAASELLGVTFDESVIDTPAARHSDAGLTRLIFQLAQLARLDEDEFGVGAEGIGSNAWAVSGVHTMSGLPMLASDPHLRQQLPSTFYLARLRGHKLHVAGATLPGLPAVIFGHNTAIAWGATNLAADVQDLYVERLAIDKEQYQSDGQWRALETHEEWIEVAPQFPAFLREPYKPIRWLARSTANGPLVSDVIGAAEQPLSLRWVALDDNDTSYQSFLAINYATDLDQFRKALRDQVSPALTFVYADRANNIARLTAGRIPIRKAGRGLLPVPGWSDDYQWSRYLEPEELPAIVNPDSGTVVSANQRIHGEDYPFLISNNWQPAYRAERIELLLHEASDQGRKLEPEDFLRIQNDVLELQADELLPFLLRQQGGTQLQREVISRLRLWDRRMSESSVGAAIYYVWTSKLMERLVKDELRVELVNARRFGELQRQLSIFRPEFLRRVVHGELSHWCGDTADACNTMALQALDDATEELARLAGGDVAEWQWGVVHRADLLHASFSEHRMLSSLFDRESAIGGGRYTVNVAVSDFAKDRGYLKHLGAAYRQIIPMHDPDNSSRFMIDAGQSGNVLDRHYDDLMPLYRAGAYVDMHAQTDKAGSDTLVLLPRTTH